MKKSLGLFLAFVLMTTMFAACAPKKETTTATPSAQPTAQPTASQSQAPASSEPSAPALSATIEWWAFPTFAKVDDELGKYEQSVIKAFNEKYPNITVNLEMIDFTAGPEKILSAIQGKTAPDVLFDAPGRIVDYGNRGVLANLNDMFTGELKSDIGNDTLLAACGNGTDYYMYPLSSAPFIMAVNGAVLEKEGLMNMINMEGDRTWTTDQFTALNKALAAKGYKNAIVFSKDQGGDQGTRAFIANLYSSSITDSGLTKYTINDANGVKALDYAISAIKAKELEDGTTFNGGEAITAFVEGRVTQTLLWAPGQILNNKAAMDANGVKQISLPLPSDNGKPNATEFLINGFCVFNNGDADKIAASKEFIRFICDDPVIGKKNVLQTNAFPVRQSFGNLYEGNEDMTFLASLNKYYGTYYNTIKGFSKMRPFWWANLQAATVGEKTAQEALDDFVKNADAAMKE